MVSNKWLIVAPNVVLTPIIAPVIQGLDYYFEQFRMKAVVTSGLRDANDQLRVIRNYLIKLGLDKTFPKAMICKVTDQEGPYYVWQMAWSALLHKNVIINPPLAAVCLLDSFRENKSNRNGVLINQTPHAKGTAFNIGGGGNGVEDEARVIEAAIKGKLPGLKGFIKERENNALHCDCVKIK
jgi:hypothetical protein